MKSAEFRENYELDAKARNLRARAKNPVDELLEILTADGTAFNPSANYFYFDKQSRKVRDSAGLMRDGEYLAAGGLRVAQIVNLHSSKDAACADAQEFCRAEIQSLQNMIAEFELEKSPAKRDLKSYLMARDAVSK